jgi:hypothetical protein
MSANTPEKPSSRAGQRLARISHHFLSDAQSRTTPGDVTRTSRPAPAADSLSPQRLVIGHSHDPSFPTLTLATLLTQQGLNCEVHQAGQTTINMTAQPPLNANSCNSKSPVTVQIHHAHDMDSIPAGTPYTLLLPTPATAAGLRQSFLQLKHQLHGAVPLRTGITITGTDDQRLAQRCFNHLSQACQKFISQDICARLYSYGLIHHHNYHQATPELTGIARLIFNDCIELSGLRHGHTAADTREEPT